MSGHDFLAPSDLQEQVDQMYVPDYCKYVAPEDEVWTELIRQRVRNGQHTSLAAMLKDFEQMAANARAYNTPGAGSLGGTCARFSPLVV